MRLPLLVFIICLIPYFGNSQVSEFPYDEDFQENGGGYIPSGDWIYETGSWKTNTQENTTYILKSPVFDFTDLVFPSIRINGEMDAIFSAHSSDNLIINFYVASDYVGRIYAFQDFLSAPSFLFTYVLDPQCSIGHHLKKL